MKDHSCTLLMEVESSRLFSSRDREDGRGSSQPRMIRLGMKLAERTYVCLERIPIHTGVSDGLQPI